jgi:hypothetical protein
LQRYQVRVAIEMKVATRRHVLRCREFADGHGDLIAGVAPGTAHAVFRYFVAEELMFRDAELEVLEEARDAGEETDALDADGFCLAEKGVDEQAACSMSFGVGADDDGADLGQVFSIDVERGAAYELVKVVFYHGEGFDVLTDLRVTPVEQGAVVSEAVDELVDGAGVLQLRSARSQGCCFELVFRCGDGSCE